MNQLVFNYKRDAIAPFLRKQHRKFSKEGKTLEDLRAVLNTFIQPKSERISTSSFAKLRRADEKDLSRDRYLYILSWERVEGLAAYIDSEVPTAALPDGLTGTSLEEVGEWLGWISPDNNRMESSASVLERLSRLEQVVEDMAGELSRMRSRIPVPAAADDPLVQELLSILRSNSVKEVDIRLACDEIQEHAEAVCNALLGNAIPEMEHIPMLSSVMDNLIGEGWHTEEFSRIIGELVLKEDANYLQ